MHLRVRATSERAGAFAGVEYLHGSRDTVDGEDGDANRLQLSLRFDI